MKTLILFYSYSGKTKAIAEQLAAEKSADLAEIRDVKRPGTLKAYLAGCPAAIGGKAWPIQMLEVDMAGYDQLHLLSPVWAGNPPPAVTAVLEKLPAGKTVAVTMVSASGGSNCRERVEAAIVAKGCTLAGWEDVRGKNKA
jgi:flavodoxin